MMKKNSGGAPTRLRSVGYLSKHGVKPRFGLKEIKIIM